MCNRISGVMLRKERNEGAKEKSVAPDLARFELCIAGL